MSDTWKQWENQTLDNKFPLLRYLGGSEHCAVFLTERRAGERLVKAAIKIIPAAPATGELQLSSWQQAAKLSHPHLIPIHEMGRFELGGVPVVYVVMECAEENLAQVLPGRALTVAEAREMLASVLDVLAYLHGKGFVHGHIKPANIMASGDELKVSSDALHRAGESLDGPGNQTPYDPPEIATGINSVSQTMSPAGDVWSLGMTLVETLTQNLPVVRTAEEKDPVLPKSLQEPYLDIARHCLVRNPQARWTVPQIEARLEGRAPMSQVRTISPEVRAASPAQQRIAAPSRPLVNSRNYTVPVAVGCALLLAAILAGPRLLRRHADAPQVPVATVEQPFVSPAPKKAAPKQAAPSPQERSAKPYNSTLAEEERSPKAPVPVPALIHPEPMREEETTTAARFPAVSPAHGEVIHQAAPEVIQSARNSIRGTVRVSVKVNVDRSGNVEDAELESHGPSKYFARAALAAAQDWKFKPPKVGGRGVLSTWTLQFEFTRDATTVVPTQEMP
jgi:TonB family protein